MFQNDVTKNYEFQDATLEILIMLAGAFLLGCLFCWALRQLGGSKKRPQATRRDPIDHRTRFDTSDTSLQNKSNLLKGAALGTSGAVGSSIASAGASIKDTAGDVGDKITDTSSSLLDSTNDAIASSKDKLADIGTSVTSSVSDTVSSASEELTDIGSGIKDGIIKTAEATGDKLSGTSSTTENDDFKKLEGIGPKIETILYAAGINTYADLRASDTDTLKAILETAGPAFKMHDPDTWPYQADLAYNKKWEKLKEYQDFLMGSED